MGPTLPNSRLRTSIYVSIASPRVFHLALHTSSDTGKEYGLHTFTRTILRQLEACTNATWLELYKTPSAKPLWNPELDPSPHPPRQQYGRPRRRH